MKKMLLTATGLIALSVPAMAQNTEVRVMPDRLVWKDNPAFPKGVQIATLVGDPTKAGEVVVLRIKFPPNFQMPPHTHPYSEVVTVISGDVGSSHSEKFEKKGDLLKPGSYGCTPQNTRITLGPEARKGYFKFSLPPRVASITSIRLTIRANSSRSHCKMPSQADTCLSGIRKEDVMRSFPKVASAALALCMVLLSFGSSALVEPKADVAAATLAWGQAIGEGDPEKVLPLYSDDAVLWGTLSPTVRSDRAALRDYFVTAFKVLPGLKVAYGDQLIRVYGNAAINTGYYTFSYVKDGEAKSLPARYSFTYVKNGERWLIVDHHSSAIPSTPR